MPRLWKGFQFTPNISRDELRGEAAKEGENGLYRATEHLAKRIASYGPGYYWGNRRRGLSSRGPACVMGGLATATQRCPKCGSRSWRFVPSSGVNTCKRCKTEWK